MSFFKREQRGRIDNPNASLQTLVGPRSQGSAAGIYVDQDRALSHVTVWACANLLASTVSGLPVDAFTKTGQGRASIDAPAVVDAPSSELTPSEWRFAVMVSLVLRGNAFGYITSRDALGYPTAIELINPDIVGVARDRSGLVIYRIASTDVPAADIWHVRAFVVPGSPVGLSPIQYAAQAIGLGLAVERFGAQFFGDGAHPTGILSTDMRVSPDAAKAAKERFQAAVNGREPVMLGDGLKYSQIQIAPEESQFLESINANAATIARLFGIPGEMIGAAASGSSVTYANREQRAIDFLTFTVNPWLQRIEEALTLTLPKPQFVKFNTGALLKSDLMTRYQSYQTALDGGWLQVDEVRALEDRPPIGDGGNASGAVAARDVAELIQKIYLGVGPVLTSDEARDIANRAGAGLNGSLPEPPAPVVDAERSDQPAFNFNVALPETVVHVDAPTVEVPVTVQAAEAPNVNVNVEPAPPVEVKLEQPITVQAAEAPNVNVNVEPAPPVEVKLEQPIYVETSAPRGNFKVGRDDKGRISELRTDS